MKYNLPKYLILPLLIYSVFCLMSCQQEPGNTVNPAAQKPKLGTRWIYRYTTYYSNGNLNTSMDVVYKAVSQDMLGGETWLRVIDSAANTTVFYFIEKPNGLYQYAGSNSNLFCKYPATISDAYTSYNGADTANYTVKGVNDTLALGYVGNVATTYYEGLKSAEVVDKLWYNPNMWLVQRYYYRKLPLGTSYFRSATLILQDFTY